MTIKSSVEFVFGYVGSGKTTYATARIVSHLSKHPGSNVVANYPLDPKLTVAYRNDIIDAMREVDVESIDNSLWVFDMAELFFIGRNGQVNEDWMIMLESFIGHGAVIVIVSTHKREMFRWVEHFMDVAIRTVGIDRQMDVLRLEYATYEDWYKIKKLNIARISSVYPFFDTMGAIKA